MLVFCQPLQSLWKENIICIWKKKKHSLIKRCPCSGGKHPVLFLCKLVCEIKNEKKGVFMMQIATVKYIQMSSVSRPTRKSDDKNMKTTLLLLLAALETTAYQQGSLCQDNLKKLQKMSHFNPERPRIRWKEVCKNPSQSQVKALSCNSITLMPDKHTTQSRWGTKACIQHKPGGYQHLPQSGWELAM